jgi:hypothetical protein
LVRQHRSRKRHRLCLSRMQPLYPRTSFFPPISVRRAAILLRMGIMAPTTVRTTLDETDASSSALELDRQTLN